MKTAQTVHAFGHVQTLVFLPKAKATGNEAGGRDGFAEIVRFMDALVLDRNPTTKEEKNKRSKLGKVGYIIKKPDSSQYLIEEDEKYLWSKDILDAIGFLFKEDAMKISGMLAFKTEVLICLGIKRGDSYECTL